jgi:Flp pilus assembly protein TadD
MRLIVHRALLLLGVLVFAGLLVTGTGFSWRRFHAIPPASLYTANYLETLLAEGDLASGVRELHQRLMIAPTAENAQTLAGVAARAGDRDELRFAARTWVRLDRRDPDAHLLLAAALLQDPDTPAPALREAAAHARRATRLAPNSARAWAILGRALLRIGRVEPGRRALKQALALDPGLQDARRALDAAERG